MRKTKIVCTIGPASDNAEMLGLLMDAGMNVARLNFSHETYEKHAAQKRIDKLFANLKLNLFCFYSV